MARTRTATSPDLLSAIITGVLIIGAATSLLIIKSGRFALQTKRGQVETGNSLPKVLAKIILAVGYRF
jgi:hypothetical protein